MEDEKIEQIENMSNQLSNIKTRLGYENKYSPDVDTVLDVYENADWRSDERIIDKLLRVMTNIAVQNVTGKLKLMNFSVSHTRLRKPKKSSKSKRKTKCKCK